MWVEIRVGGRWCWKMWLMRELEAEATVGDALCILFRVRNRSWPCLFGDMARDINAIPP